MTATIEERAYAGAARILMVDDEPANLQVLREALVGLGHQLLVARNGESALELAARAHPHLVLLDIMMPGIDGYETCRRLKADAATADSAVIFLSAMDDTESKVRGLELGAVDYVAKPFKREEVIARVNTHLTLLHLQRELSEANRRMRRDLEAAATVQRSLLPASVPDWPALRVTWRYRPCDELAGDSLNAFRLDDHSVCLYVLDVAGHGVASALLSVSVARALLPGADAIVQSRDGEGALVPTAPAEVMRLLNARFPMGVGGDYFFTIVYALLDTRTGRLEYAAAGHPAPLRLTGDGVPDERVPMGPPIGVFDDAHYRQATLVLEPGDRVYLYSDGLYEAWNDEEEMFGEERLIECLTEARELPLEAGLEQAMTRLDAWSGGRGLEDDVAVIALELLETRSRCI